MVAPELRGPRRGPVAAWRARLVHPPEAHRLMREAQAARAGEPRRGRRDRAELDEVRAQRRLPRHGSVVAGAVDWAGRQPDSLTGNRFQATPSGVFASTGPGGASEQEGGS